jgi:hypothetical protein
MNESEQAKRYLELANAVIFNSELPITGTEEEEIATALRRLAEIDSRQSRPIHSCDIPGCMSCGNPPDSDYRLPEHKE